jgi:hypothetical protein
MYQLLLALTAQYPADTHRSNAAFVFSRSVLVSGPGHTEVAGRRCLSDTSCHGCDNIGVITDRVEYACATRSPSSAITQFSHLGHSMKYDAWYRSKTGITPVFIQR